MVCRCGHVQLEDPPQVAVKEPSVLYYDLETALISTSVFAPGKQYISWKSLESESYVICWGAAWMYRDKLKVMSDCVTPQEAKKKDDSRCLWRLWELMDSADYLVGHNMRSFDWKFASSRFITHGWDAPSDARIIDTLSLSRRRFRPGSHALESWSKRLGGNPKDDMRRTDWEDCLKGDEKALRKMVRYCRGDIREGVSITEKFVKYIESASGLPVFR